MPIEFQITGAKELVAKLQQVGPKVRENARDGIQRLQQTLRNNIQRLFLSGTPLHVRTGNLRNSINVGPIQESASEIRGPVGTNALYAAIQNYGGTITPKSAQYLTIPLDAAKTPSGVARFSARQIIANPGEGGYKSTFFRNQVLFGVQQGGTIEALFALKSSITIPARPFMEPGLESVRDDMSATMTLAVQRAKEGLGL